MKDQYFGDVSDYAKYALLRLLAQREGLQVTLCWMMTESDQSADGRFVDYLRAPQRYANLDPELFAFLLDAVTTGRRNTGAIERSGLLNGVTFHNKVLTDDSVQRREFFRELWRMANGSGVVFFDPDNGLSVQSTAKGTRNSRKYLFWDELATTTSLGHSAMVYQHFPRVARVPFVETVISKMRKRLRMEAFVAYTSKVAFLVAAHREHEPHLRGALRDACASSTGLLTYAA